MAKFKVGDRVKIRQWDDMKREYGMDPYGAIMMPCTFMPEMRKYCGKTVIIQDVASTLRDDRYHIKGGDGWCFSDEMFETPATVRVYEALKSSRTQKTLKPHKPIVIYQEDREVIAQDTQTGKTGVARCHPNDKFDFYYGTGLAIERLTGYKSEPEPEPVVTRKPKYYSGKVVCVENYSCFTVGKVYTIKDGVLYSDAGEHFDSIEDIDWLNKHFNSQFIKFVG